MTALHDVAIIGCGFAGSMVLVHLVEKLPRGSSIAVFDDSNALATGPAYETKHIEHLLNVRAGRMGAYADQPEHFWQWCETASGAEARRELGVSATIEKESFVPRALYGAYLRDIYRNVQKMAAQTGIAIVHYRQRIVRLESGGVLHTQAGEVIRAMRVVCASGFAFSHNAESRMISAPWNTDFSAFSGDAQTAFLIGAGLTAVDTIMSLLKAGFGGRIICLSRHRRFPHAHPHVSTPLVAPALPQEPLRLSSLMRFARKSARLGNVWQDGVDSLRPITITLWQLLSTEDQRRFLTRYFSLWNIHRHRMAPEIYTILQEAIAQGRVQHVCGSFVGEDVRGVYIERSGEKEHIAAAHLFDCRGPSYRALPPYLSVLINAGIVKPHATGAGVCADERMQIAENIFALGALLLGQQLETTAVPELRLQAQKLSEIVATA